MLHDLLLPALGVLFREQVRVLLNKLLLKEPANQINSKVKLTTFVSQLLLDCLECLSLSASSIFLMISFMSY